MLMDNGQMDEQWTDGWTRTPDKQPENITLSALLTEA